MTINDYLLNAFRHYRAKGRVPSHRAITAARHDFEHGKRWYDDATYSVIRNGSANVDGARWIENPKACGFRFIGTFSDILKRHSPYSRDVHNGWYIRDDDPSETVSGEVWQLPTRRGTLRYVSAVTGSCGGNGRLMYLRSTDIETTDDPDDASAILSAARYANSHAKRYAEDVLAYDAAWQAGARYTELRDERNTTRRELLTLIAETRKAYPSLQSFKAIRDTIAATIRDKRAEMSQLLDQMDTLASGDHEDFGFDARRYANAFNDDQGL